MNNYGIINLLLKKCKIIVEIYHFLKLRDNYLTRIVQLFHCYIVDE